MLLCAGLFAVLVKSLTPLFCVAPGLFILYRIATNIHTFYNGFRSQHAIVGAFAFLLGLLAAFWYGNNLETLIRFIRLAAYSPRWGAEDPFISKVFFWLNAIKEEFWLPEAYWTLLILTVSTFLVLLIRRNIFRGTWLIVIISLAQIVLTIAVFSSAVNDCQRYLLPLLPYIGLLTAWMLIHIDKRAVTICVFAVFIFQFFSLQGASLGIINRNQNSHEFHILDKVGNAEMYREITNTTCGDNTAPNLLGLTEPLFEYGEMIYFNRKNKERNKKNCRFEPVFKKLARHNRKLDLELIWQNLEALNPSYLVMLDLKYLNQNQTISYAIEGDNLIDLVISNCLLESGAFEKVAFPKYPQIAIYKKVGKGVPEKCRSDILSWNSFDSELEF